MWPHWHWISARQPPAASGPSAPSPVSRVPLPHTAFHTPTAPTGGTLTLEAKSESLLSKPSSSSCRIDLYLPTPCSWWAACAQGPSLCPQFLVPAGTASFSCLQPPSLSVPLGVWTLKISSILKNSSLYFPEDFQPSLPRMVLLMVLLYVRIIVIVFS